MNYLYRAALSTYAAVMLISCAKANDTSANIDVRTGKHLSGWLVATNGGAHPAVFLADSGVCHECHGTDLKGGISTVSCFSASRNGINCHAGGPSSHPAGWVAAGFHGAAAKAADGGITVSGQFSTTSSLAKCAQCHGTAYDGGIIQKSCLNTAGCHGTGGAPHPARPWFSTSGGVTHTTTDTVNAGQCAVCHTNGAHSTRIPNTGDATGSSGCFNNTLCHGAKVGGHAFPNPGSVHRVAANGSGCLNSSCHALGSAASSYPATAGTPPDCRSCHIGANPGTNPQCSDCHGSAATGLPNGASFPNRLGRHNTGFHPNYPCTACHPFTSGDSRHGWSNRQKSSAAQVKVVTTGTGIRNWNAVTKSCTPTCHGTETW